MGAGASPGRLFCCSFPRSDNRAGQLSTQSGVYLWFRGRKKEVIVRGGIEHLAPEVEAVLYQHTAAARKCSRRVRFSMTPDSRLAGIRGTGLWKVALARNGLLRPDVRGSNDVSPFLG